MVAILCRNGTYLRRLTRSVPADERAVHVQSWEELIQASASCRCSVVLIEWLLNDMALAKLHRFRMVRPMHPLILVTLEDPDNARCIKAIHVNEVLWIREVPTRLRPALEHLRNRGTNQRIAAAINGNRRIPQHLRDALQCAVNVERPPRSVNRLAQLVGCHRSTLWLQWRKLIHPANTPRLEDFLGWLLLLAAVDRKAPGISWTVVSAELGVHGHTLTRLSKKLVGAKLSDLSRLGLSRLLDRFTREFDAPLFGSRKIDILR